MDNPAFVNDGNDGPSTSGHFSGKFGSPKDGNLEAVWTNQSSPSPSVSVQKLTNDDDEVNLKRSVGLIGSIALIVGTMIGSGIFVSPNGVIQNVQSVWLTLIVWGACGLLSLFGGITYIELSSVIPASGAEYSYLLSTFGAIPGFLTVWSCLTLIRPAQIAVICLAFAEYTVDPFVSSVSDVPWAVKLVCCVAIALLTFLNCMSTKLASQIQIVFTVAKLLAIVIIIGGGIYNLFDGKTSNFTNDFSKVEWNFGQIARAMFSGLWAYDGWNQLNVVTEEIKDPYRNLPRAIIFGLPLVTILYLLVNVSYLTVIDPTEMAELESVANVYGDRVLGVMSFLMPLAVALSTFGAANGTLFTAARITYVAGREGHLPDCLSFVTVQRNTPVVSLIVNGLISMFLAVALDIAGLIDFFSFAAWIFYGATGAAMIVLRFTRPDAPRPFKAPIFMPIILVVMSTFLVIAPVALDPQIEYLYATVFILCGLILYIPFVHFKYVLWGMEGFTRFIQLIFEAVPPEGVQDEVLITASKSSNKNEKSN